MKLVKAKCPECGKQVRRFSEGDHVYQHPCWECFQKQPSPKEIAPPGVGL